MLGERQEARFRVWAACSAVAASLVATSVAGGATLADATALTVTPAADSWVSAASPTATNATSKSLRVRTSGSTILRTFLKFTVTGLAGAPTSARLRLYVTDASAGGGNVYRVADTTWTEAALNWNTQPPLDPSPLATIGAVTVGSWVEADLGTTISGDGTYSFAVAAGSSDPAWYASRETTTPPQLVLETGAAGPPTAPANTSPPVISGSAFVGMTLTADPGTWAGTEPIDYGYQWRRCDATGAPCEDIAAATERTYVTAPDDVGSRLGVTVTASNAGGEASHASALTAVVAAGGDPVIAAAGDIACDPRDGNFNGGLGTSSACRQQATSDLLVDAGLAAVLGLGDIQYECAGADAFRQSYDPSWGRVLPITHPATGNHEYDKSGTDCDATGTAGGYFGYFGAAAGDPSKGYYSFDVGSWHVIALNSNCSNVGGCGAGSAQERWLRADLALHPATCTLAYWHHPRFSSARLDIGAASEAFWRALHEARADIVLVGHDHLYERFAPQDPAGNFDHQGVRQFTVGTGGKSLFGFKTVRPNSEVRARAYGVLKLVLRPTGYEWEFVPAAGEGFTDTGSTACSVSGPADTTAPDAPADLRATAVAARRVDLEWTAATDDTGVTGYEIRRNGDVITTVGAVTSFADTTAAPSTAYTYTLRARDVAGNWSGPSNQATATTPADSAPPPPTAITPTDDGYVRSDSPTSNFAGQSVLRAYLGSREVRSYLRFAVTGLAAAPASALLRLYVTDASSGGGILYTAPTAWTESTLTWDTRPALGTLVRELGPVTVGQWVEIDVTGAITGDGAYGFAIAGATSDVAYYASREGGQPPQLVIVP